MQAHRATRTCQMASGDRDLAKASTSKAQVKVKTKEAVDDGFSPRKSVSDKDEKSKKAAPSRPLPHPAPFAVFRSPLPHYARLSISRYESTLLSALPRPSLPCPSCAMNPPSVSSPQHTLILPLHLSVTLYPSVSVLHYVPNLID